jgi:hypothetical protein
MRCPFSLAHTVPHAGRVFPVPLYIPVSPALAGVRLFSAHALKSVAVAKKLDMAAIPTHRSRHRDRPFEAPEFGFARLKANPRYSSK